MDHKSTGLNLPPEEQSSNSMSSGSPKNRKILIAAIIAILVLLALIAGFLWWKTTTDNDKTSSTTSPVKKKHNAQTAFTWSHLTDPKAIPLGDGRVSASPKIGYVYACRTNFRNAAHAHGGPWINEADKTWDSTAKVTVEGNVSWPTANYSEKINSVTRTLKLNDLPEGYPTGIFPIRASDPAYQYDTNPNSIQEESLVYNLPLQPAAAKNPGCTPLGAIGVFNNGVLLFNALDDSGNDAVAHETQDKCGGHPNGKQNYHYHNAPDCMRDKAKGSSVLLGYALDGYGIYLERDSKGNLPTNQDLDECHGRASKVEWNGEPTNIYHYSVTLEYPYTIGCFHGTAVTTQSDRLPRMQPRGHRHHH